MTDPLCGQGRAVHDLNLVLAVRIGAVEPQADLFSVVEGKLIDHGEILGCGVVISDSGGDIADIIHSLEPAGIAGAVLVQNQLACTLIDQIPVIAGVFGKYSLGEGCGNFVCAFLCHKTVDTAGVGRDGLAVDLQSFVAITAVGSDCQLHSVANAIKILICRNLAV